MNRSEDPAAETPPADEVRLRLAVGGVRIAFRGRRAFFQRHVAALVEAAYARAGLAAAGERPGRSAAPAQPPRPAPEPETFQPSAPAQFSQFVAQVGQRAATPEQQIMAFVFYLWNYEKRDAVAAPDLEAFFRTVQAEPPEDLAEQLRTLVSSRRFLQPAEGGSAWQLTPKGVNYVKNRLLASD